MVPATLTNADNDAYLVVFDKYKVAADPVGGKLRKLCVEAK